MELEIKELDIKKDDRGSTIEIIKRNLINDDIKEVLLISSKPGVIRGNHYHEKKAEWLCIIHGKAKFVYEDIKTGERKEAIIDGEKPTIIKTPVNVSHAVQNIGDDDLLMIEVSGQIYDEKAPDTFRKQII